ncbi:MAG: formylglycine-generating enzyme family protein [Candidatus Electrothrix sp. GW3-4]|uniref:formylglycine-generating enzyme family protein n=1 Tax=Candidatus Electrothrix sp. GW3-4 TaxID=3126740 RepID=UPI0030CEDBA4
MMGSPADEADRLSTEDFHKVSLTRGYWLADTAVTQAAWQAIIGRNPVEFQDDKFNPVEEVSWDNAQEFITELNRRIAEAGGTEEGMLFRLPTEAEWEHACRAGTDTPFSFGTNITPEQVNYNGNRPYANGEKGAYRKKTVPVKSLPPNPWGLYEMHGNVWEWCADSWEEHLGEQPVADPYHASGSFRVMRGGSWGGNGRNVRSACRFHYSPDRRDDNVGFRLASGHKLRPHGSAQDKGQPPPWTRNVRSSDGQGGAWSRKKCWLLVPRLCLGMIIVKLRFIWEAGLQGQGFPSRSLGTRGGSEESE